ncbi:MAG: hypothetical protein SFU56_13220 [Capsulimonadales bacterium]|nr:hypothetical protein [Capsulimonadales bacterium]
MAEGKSAEKTKRCAACGGELAQGVLKAGNLEATIVVAGKPDGFLGVIPYTTSQIAARVCTDCGRIELYARNRQDLLKVDGNE